MSTQLPPMRAVQVFEAVVRCGSVTAAAEELCVSPGAISQQIHNIEKALNVRLFERSGRSLALTSWGRIYYERVRFAFEQLRTAQDTLSRARSKPGIVLSALPSLAIRWLRPLMLQWRAAHPGAAVRLVGTDEESSLRDEQIDFRISYGTDVRQYEHFTELFIDTVVPACSAEFLAKHPVQTAADILGSPLIDIEWDVRHRPAPSWDDWARSAGLPQPDTAAELAFSLSSAAIDAAVSGGGFVLGQVAMIHEDVASGRLEIPIDRRLTMPAPYFLAWDRAVLDRPYGEDFRAFIIAAARRQAAQSAGRAPLAPARARVQPFQSGAA
ncbi:MAG: LysR family transcriptional regulator [Rhodospirillaceae bacterium]|nr:LysR family transcriptional regulator [Rhodospirillaceae bacterium]